MFTKKRILQFLAALMLSGPIFIACESEKADFDQDIQSSLTQEAEAEVLNDRENFAKALSLAVQDDDFSNEVIERTMEKENGDRVFLYALAKTQDVEKTGQSFERQLLQSAQENIQFRDDAESFNLDAADSDPSLSVYLHVPEGMDETHVDPSSVRRVYVSSDDDNNLTADMMITYFENGEMGQHSVLSEPSIPVFVIKANERVLAYDPSTGLVLPYNIPLENHLAGNLIEEFLEPESLVGMIDGIEYRIVFRGGNGGGSGSGPGTGGGDPPGGGGDDPCDEECERDCEDGKDVLTRFKFSDDHEGWFMGGPEVLVRVIFADNPSNQNNPEFDMIEKQFNIKKKQTNKWQYKNAEIINWDEDSYGDAMLYHWVEKDPGGSGGSWPIQFGVGFAGINFNIRTEIPRNKDDFFGESIIQYCDNWNDPDIPSGQQNAWSTYGYHYIAGDMEFAVKERNY